jgi:hypothetical protein
MATMLPANTPGPGRLADTLTGLFRRVVSPEEGLPRLHRVGVCVIDGLGADLLLEYSGHARFLSARLKEVGATVHSGLPSTTASALASVTTGMSAGEHGLLGYQVRDPHSGEMVNHLKPFPSGVEPEQWQPQPTVFEQAATHSIPSIAVGESRFSGTDFSRATLRGAEFRGSAHPDSHLEILREFFDSYDDAVAYLYWPALDRIGHQLGVSHSNWVDALETVDQMARALHGFLQPGEALILTADHGMVDVTGENQVWWPKAHPLRSQISMWAGEPRLVQLYCQPGVDLEEFAAAAQQWLGECASVLTRHQVVDRGIFGAVTEAHAPRIGDVVVFSEGQHALYDELTATETSAKMVGQHGSWTTTEVAVPAIPLGPDA